MRPPALCTSDYGVLMRWYARPEGDCARLNLAPQLDSWDRADNRSQVQLGKFLHEADTLLAASRIDGPWALRLDVGLAPHLDLLDKRDLDNYAKPLASRLSDGGLVSVWCTKRSGGHSAVRIEAAREVPAPSIDRCSARYDDRLLGRTRGEGADPLGNSGCPGAAGWTSQARTRLHRRA